MDAAVESRREQIVILAEQQGAAVRRHLILGDHLALCVDPAIAAIEVDADQFVLLLLVDLDEDAVGIGAELRIGAVADDSGGSAAGGGNAEDAAFARPAVRGQALAAARFVDDGRAVGREARAAIMAGLLGDRAQADSIGCDGARRAERLVVPRNEGYGGAVA